MKASDTAVNWLVVPLFSRYEFVHGTDIGDELQVMTVVKRLVHTGITICATIHSPTPYGAHSTQCSIWMTTCRPALKGICSGVR